MESAQRLLCCAARSVPQPLRRGSRARAHRPKGFSHPNARSLFFPLAFSRLLQRSPAAGASAVKAFVSRGVN